MGLPTFGLAAREQERLRTLTLREEPLIQEMIGLQMLASLMGLLVGPLGFFLGLMHGGSLCFLPGRVGEGLRRAGWHTFQSLGKAYAALWRLCVACRACSVSPPAAGVPRRRAGSSANGQGPMAQRNSPSASPLPREGTRPAGLSHVIMLAVAAKKWPLRY